MALDEGCQSMHISTLFRRGNAVYPDVVLGYTPDWQREMAR